MSFAAKMRHARWPNAWTPSRVDSAKQAIPSAATRRAKMNLLTFGVRIDVYRYVRGDRDFGSRSRRIGFRREDRPSFAADFGGARAPRGIDAFGVDAARRT